MEDLKYGNQTPHTARARDERLSVVLLNGTVRMNPVEIGRNLTGLNPHFTSTGETTHETFSTQEKRFPIGSRARAWKRGHVVV